MIIKLALRNIKSSFKDYTIYFITLMISVCIFYMFNSIESQKVVLNLSESKDQMLDVLVIMIKYLSYFIAGLMGFLIIYANNFLIKRRSKELGLYMLLGMKKEKISFIIIIETAMVGLLSLVCGLILGIYLGQLFSIFTVKIFKASVSNYQFIFSTSAFKNTLICFATIFIVVMIFNIFTISKTKLINLIQSENKNENNYIKKIRFSIVFFIFSIIFLVFGYYFIIDNNLEAFDIEFFLAFLFTFIGTVFFFIAASSCLLILLKRTKWYYKKLNMFVTKEVNKNINSNIGTMIFSCLILAVTIVVLSSSFALTRGINNLINGASPYDISFYNYEGVSNYNSFGTINLDDYIEESFEIKLYNYETITYKSVLDKNSNDAEKLYFIKLSDYNTAMRMQKEKEISLNDNEVYINLQIEVYRSYIEEKLNETINIFDKNYTIKDYDKINITTTVGTDDGVYIIINDDMIDVSPSAYFLNMNYKKDINDDIFFEAIENELPDDAEFEGCSKQIVADVNTGVTALVTFIALYVSIVFLIACVLLLSIQQLSKIQDNIENYRLLNKLGVNETTTSKTIFIQTLFYFLFPLILAIVHSVIGMIVVHNVLLLHAPAFDIMSDILLTSLVFFAIYGLYFFITFICCNRIIKKAINN